MTKLGRCVSPVVRKAVDPATSELLRDPSSAGRSVARFGLSNRRAISGFAESPLPELCSDVSTMPSVTWTQSIDSGR